MNKSMLLVVAVVSLAFAIPASAQTKDKDIPPGGLAQNQAECQAQFRSADSNNDGVLSESEVSASKTQMPAELGSKKNISRQEFLSSCNSSAKATRQP
jgi:hypothetical protein